VERRQRGAAEGATRRQEARRVQIAAQRAVPRKAGDRAAADPRVVDIALAIPRRTIGETAIEGFGKSPAIADSAGRAVIVELIKK
jgi:hypothetical protein